MPTTFDTDFEDDDIIEVIHVKQYAQPINDLEDALEDKQDILTGTADVPGLTSALAAKQDTSEKGQANGYASLDGSGLVPSSQLPAASGGAEELNDLDDVSINTPAEGQVLRYDGTAEEFVNADMAIADVDGLQTALNSKQDELTEPDDVPGLTSALAAKQDTSEKGQANGYASLDGSGLVPSSQLPAASGGAEELNDLDDVSINTPAEGQVLRYDGTAEEFVNADMAIADVDGLQTALSSKQDELTEPDDVPGLTSALAAKQDTSEKGQANGYAGLDSNATVPIAQGGTAATTAATARANLGTNDAANITTGTLPLARGGTGANLSATGGAGQVLKQSTSGGAVSVGALAAGDMPTGIDATKIGTGSVSNTEFGYLDGVTSSIQTQLDSKLGGTSTLPISQGGTGATTAANARTNLGTNDAANITAGTLPIARGGTGATTAAAARTNLGAAATSHNHDASNITSGTLPITRGGTGATTAASARSNIGAVGGSGTSARIALWNASNNITSSVGPPLYLHSPRNLGGAGGILYWSTSNGEVFYQFSRGFHKKEIQSLSTTIEDLMKWRAVEFKWKEKFGGEEDLGLIAEEVASVCPRAATYDQPWEYTDEETGAYAVDEDGNPKKKPGKMIPAGVKYEKAWIPMLAALQDFYKRFQAFEEKVEARLVALEGAK